jgi:hypothetical protein
MFAHGRWGSGREQTAAVERHFKARPADGFDTFGLPPDAHRFRERYARNRAVKSKVNQRPARSRKYEKPEGRR